MSLKHKLGEIWLRRYLKKREFEREPSRQSGSGIAILFSGDSLAEQQDVQGFVKKLERVGYDVFPFAYIPKELGAKVTFGFPHFSKSDFGIVPDFSKHKLSLFLQRGYHACVHIDINNHLILHYVAEQVQAINKLSISPIYPKLYDIVVQREDGDTLAVVLEKTFDIFEKTIGR